MQFRIVRRSLLGLSATGLVVSVLAPFFVRATLLPRRFLTESAPSKAVERTTPRHVIAHLPSASPVAIPRARVLEAYGSLPLSFEANEGQTDASVRYISHGPGYTMLLTSDQAIVSLAQPNQTDRLLEKMDKRTRKRFESRKYYRLSPRFRRQRKSETIRVTVAGANPSPTIIASDQLPGTANYFIGRDRSKWRTGIRTYGKIKYSQMYPGVDLVYYGRRGRLEFDFVVAPGADPKEVGLHFEAPGPLSITQSGAVGVATTSGPFELLHPDIYQVINGRRIPIKGQFELRNDENTVGIRVSQYDRQKPLIIDPVLSYSTYLGGSGSDYDAGVAVDSQGDAFIAGQTTSTNFPTANGDLSSGNSNGVAFVSELNPTGTALLYSTYLGGTGGDWGADVALDPSGNVYVTGATLSSDFPVVNATQWSLLSPNGNAFVARLDTTQAGAASLVYSSYLGGGSNASTSLGEVGLGIAADAAGLAYVTGQTASDSSLAPFPTTNNAIQSSLSSVNGNAFLTVLDTTNGGPLSLMYSTYLGGASSGFGDYGVGITVDNMGDAFLTGQTTSGGANPFPTTSGAYQTTLNSENGNVFVTEIATSPNSCQCLVYSTYLGGSSTIIVGDTASGIGLDSGGKIYVGGDTTSADFPVSAGAFQSTNSPGGKAFVAAFDPPKAGSSSLIYSTLLGGTNGGEGEVINALVVDGSGDAFAAGSSSSSDFPTTTGALQTTIKNSSWDAFLSEVNPTGTSLLYSTYFGGSCANGDLGNGVALDWVGNPYLAGSTCSTDLPVYPQNAYQTSLAGSYNTFVAKIAVNPTPGIKAIASPTANSGGWNNSSVTVSFICIPGGAAIQTCPSPVVLGSEGASQTASGTVVDTVNASATATDTVNLDMTPPVISISSPSNGATVTSTSLTVTGTITDALSGVSTAACNGQQATVTGSGFSCALQISSAINTITVTGTDVAGNTASATIGVNLSIPGGFATTNNLNVARQGHTATLLTNGMVLIAGGEDGNSVVQATAEVYNPATATFTATGNMSVARMNHTATLLNDGTVLITGGYDSNYNPLNSAEIYNPATGTFTAIASMSTGRASHTATLLQDGTVLIAGGYDTNYNALSSAELYNPAAGTFTGVGGLATGRVMQTATLLNNGQVLIVGGEDTNYDILASAELYTPTSQTFTATGNLNIGRYLQSATLLNNGQVLVAAGEDASYTMEASAELFDPNAGTFSFTGNLGTARDAHTATLLTNGSVLIAGGVDGSYNTTSSTELFDPVLRTFSASGSLNTARSNQTATLLTDGTLLIAGGYESTGGVDPTLANSEIYQPTSMAPANLVSIALSPSAPSVSAGAAQRFTATGTFSDNSTEVLSAAVWGSSNNTIATVTNDWTNHGAVFGVAPGSATLSACTGTICGSTNLTVSAAQLSITSLSPAAGDIGSQVIVSGTGFGATQGSSTVTFNGTGAVVSLWSATAIIATVPAGATSGNIVVTVGGTNSNGTPFTITSGPVITSISPSEGFAGDAVTISGTNFGATQGSSTVAFNGLPAVVNSWSNNSIGVTVPDGATTGNVVATVSGLASNAVPFTVATIIEIAPSSGPVGMLVTIEGSGFGATQGSGIASINGTPMQVVSWSDDVILAAVGSGTNSGAVTVQQGSVSISGPFFTIDTGLPYNVSPQTLSLSVGQSQTLSAPTGLQWITTNPGIVTLSKDDPPVLTGIAAGSATVYAGAVPISVTVYAGSASAGTVLWSAPGGQPIPAVPSSSGVDVFVQNGGSLEALKADGTIAWQVQASNVSPIPDFSGNAYLYGGLVCGGGCFTHQLWRLDPTTHQPNTLYTFSTTPDPCQAFLPYSNGITCGYQTSDRMGTEMAIPDTSGNLFVQDINQVLVFDSNGNRVSDIPLESTQLTYICTGNTGIDCSQQLTGNFTEPPVAGRMIVAGDGNAYIPYIYGTYTLGINGTDGPITNGSNLVLLRVSPDGSYSKMQLANAQQTTTVTGPPNEQQVQVTGCVYEQPIYVFGDLEYNLSVRTPPAVSVITNADQGVTVFSPPADCGTVSSGQIPANMWQVSGDQLTSQANLSVQYFWPELQLADGSYVGTEGDSEGETLGNPVTSQSAMDIADVSIGGVVWQQGFSSPVLPLYATDDGNVTVTSTQYSQANTTLQPGVPEQFGTLYTVGQNGSVMSQVADTGNMYSWKGTYTAQTDPSVQSVATLIPDLAATYAAVIGGNLTGNGFSLLHHTFGIVFCNTIQGVGDGSCPSNTTDMSFIYSPGVLQENQTGCDFSVASACNGNTAHPEWVAAIKNNALNAYIAAFSQLPVIVNQGQKPQMLYGGSSSTTNFDHTIYIDGSWSTNGGGECPGPGLTTAPKWSWVFYLNDECNAEVNLGPYNANNPDFTPPLSDSTNMLKLAAAIGRTIGNTAAHETAWQIQNSGTVLPGMECGPGSENQYEPNGKACENGINSVYEAASSGEWDSVPNYLPAISWEPTDMKILDRYFSNIH